jgi:hypothetical protein
MEKACFLHFPLLIHICDKNRTRFKMTTIDLYYLCHAEKKEQKRIKINLIEEFCVCGAPERTFFLTYVVGLR